MTETIIRTVVRNEVIEMIRDSDQVTMQTDEIAEVNLDDRVYLELIGE